MRLQSRLRLLVHLLFELARVVMDQRRAELPRRRPAPDDFQLRLWERDVWQIRGDGMRLYMARDRLSTSERRREGGRCRGREPAESGRRR